MSFVTTFPHAKLQKICYPFEWQCRMMDLSMVWESWHTLIVTIMILLTRWALDDLLVHDLQLCSSDMTKWYSIRLLVPVMSIRWHQPHYICVSGAVAHKAPYLLVHNSDGERLMWVVSIIGMTFCQRNTVYRECYIRHKQKPNTYNDLARKEL